MSLDPSNLQVRHNPEKLRFEIALEGDDLALVEYMLAGKNIIFTHTEVPPRYEGQGVGNLLAKVALDYAVEQGLKIQPLCPFIKAYVKRHSEYQAHVWNS